jgi:hypothetical protein
MKTFEDFQKLITKEVMKNFLYKSSNNILISERENPWPPLVLDEWIKTYKTLHLWMQIVGKIKLSFSPKLNHWWHITFTPTAEGLTTGLIPYHNSYFQIDFDFIDHKLYMKTNDGKFDSLDLYSRSVADFYIETKEKLRHLGIEINIWTTPVEMEERIPFERDFTHKTYDKKYVETFHEILLCADHVMKVFRSEFTGKSSPVHFFWGAMDLAVTFFSGKHAPVHPGVPNVSKEVMVEAYSKELSSYGFWPGLGLGEAAFYAYAYPQPDKFNTAKMPEGAYYNETLGEFILPYEKVRASESPKEMILSFFKAVFIVSARLNRWDEGLICYK